MKMKPAPSDAKLWVIKAYYTDGQVCRLGAPFTDYDDAVRAACELGAVSPDKTRYEVVEYQGGWA